MDISVQTATVESLASVWRTLGQSGTADQHVAHVLQTGLGSYLEAFENRHIGATGLTQGTKLVLGKNGEGKTHLLYCIRAIALRNGHAVAMLDPKTASVGDSAFAFAHQVLRSLETSELAENPDSDMHMPTLLKVAVERKRQRTLDDHLNPDVVLPRWADGMRDKDLHPYGLGDALADGLRAAIDDDRQGIRKASACITFESAKYSRRDADKEGSRLLQSIPRVVQLLGFKPLVILLDEAETAVEHKGRARQLEFLKFLRFLNDHVAGISADGAQALAIIGCTDELWPDKFLDYAALHSRLVDPGRDSVADRADLKPRALARMNKVWVRETFRGETADYEALGASLVDIASRVYPRIDVDVQKENAKCFARVASSNSLRKQVKRTFIKAFCRSIDTQVEDEVERPVTDVEAESALDAAVKAIQDHDEAL